MTSAPRQRRSESMRLLGTRSNMVGNDRETIGLLAGWGRYPLAVAEALRAQGYRVACLGILDHADPVLSQHCSEFDWIGLGAVGKAIRRFRRWGVSRAVMAGKIHKVVLHRPGWWIRHRPDWKCIMSFAAQLLTGTADRKDDTLLCTLVDAFGGCGIEIVPATFFAPELLVSSGTLTSRSLSAKQLRDVQFGWKHAKEVGRLDIGQTVCVKDQTVLAVEAIEGTDLCIQRAGDLCRKGGFTVVKVAKPQQDMRFDVPTVGAKTLNSIADAGGSALVIEAGRTILLDGEDFRRTAERLKISVLAIDESVAVRSAA